MIVVKATKDTEAGNVGEEKMFAAMTTYQWARELQPRSKCASYTNLRTWDPALPWNAFAT